MNDKKNREFVRTLHSMIADFLRNNPDIDRSYYQEIWDWLEKKEESEDERIRKEILEFVRTRGGFKGEWITYLEKQKEQRYTKEEVLEELRIDLCNNDIYRVPEWLREVLLMAKENGKKEQQLAEWSEEDLQHKSWILECLADGKRTMPQYAADFHAAYNWLKSLGPQPKQEWSEEEIVNWLKENFYVSSFDNTKIVTKFSSMDDLIKSFHKRFKSLFSRPKASDNWKPTKEQLIELRCAISGCSFETSTLEELENQLKAL